MAIPQYAIPQVGSFSPTAANVSLAFSNQKEWSIATALLNCDWTAGSQETGKFTLPSLPGSPAGCSCWATTGPASTAQTPASSSAEVNARRLMLASFVCWTSRTTVQPTRQREGLQVADIPVAPRPFCLTRLWYRKREAARSVHPSHRCELDR